MSLLPPAYRGAPYHQPRPLSRRHRALRLARLGVLVAAGVLLVVITGAWLWYSSVP